MAATGSRAAFRIVLRSATGPVEVKVELDAGPIGLADLAEAVFPINDALVASATDSEARAGRIVSCRAGCGACCRQLVPVSPPEALHLARVVASLPEPRKSEVEARFAAIAATLEERGLGDALYAGDRTDRETMAPLALAYWRLDMACPFLVDESCSIHRNRPIACREHNVTTPAAWCADFERGGDVRPVPMPTPLSAPLARLASELAGGPMRAIPLALALRFAKEERELAARRWPGVELFERFLALASRIRA